MTPTKYSNEFTYLKIFEDDTAVLNFAIHTKRISNPFFETSTRFKTLTKREERKENQCQNMYVNGLFHDDLHVMYIKGPCC